MKKYFRKLKLKWYQYKYRQLSLGYGSVVIGSLTLTGKGRVNIGSNCRLVNVKINADGFVNIGERCFLTHTKIVCKEKIEIDTDCIISDAYIVDTDFHNLQPNLRHAPPTAKATRPIKIKRNVWIGDNGTVLKGSEIGENSVVGSMSVVRGLIPDNVVVIGNPAIIVKKFD